LGLPHNDESNVSLKKLLLPMTPAAVLRWYESYKQARALAEVPALECDASQLLPATGVRPREIFSGLVGADEWEEVQHSLRPFALPSGTGGVNPGDQRAIYCLLRHFNPTSVLEVGTHIGASTVHIASALARSGDPSGQAKTLLSVDISDVNDPESKPWLRAGSKHSPAAMIEQLGYDGFVGFKTGASLDHLASGATYDFIFLDGDHSANTVYREVPAALRALNPGGVILLHDFFPDQKSLWPDGHVIPGPFLGINRHKKGGARLSVVPLGDLPWPTKQGSNTTSLALLLGQGT